MARSNTTVAVVAVVAGFALGQGASGARAVAWQGPPTQPAAGIHTESGNRLPVITRDVLDDFGRTEYDEIQAEIRAGRMLAGLSGPVGIRLYSPRVSNGTLRSNLYLRFESGIGRRLYELAVLVTARELNQQFEWTAHEPAARQAGVDQSVIDVVKFRRSAAGLEPRDALVIQIGRDALHGRTVPLETYDKAIRTFGEKNLVDIVAVMGEYASMAALLNTFDQRLRPDQAPLLPMP